MIEQGEHQQLDFKFEVSDSKKIARSLVAFANTDGGKLLVGVKDNGKIAGVRSEEEYHMLEAAADMFSRPVIPMDIKQWKPEGKMVLEVIVSKSDQKPHTAPWKDEQWKVFIRSGDQNLLANGILLEVWERQKSKTPVRIEYRDESAEKRLLDMLRDEEKTSFSQYCKRAGISLGKARNVIVNLILLDVIEQEITEKGNFLKVK